MIYNLAEEFERTRADAYFVRVKDNDSICEIKKFSPKRTNAQNRYLHAIFNLIALEYGYTTEEAKILCKRDAGLVYDKNGEKFLTRTADLDTSQMTAFIETIRNIYTPHSDQKTGLRTSQ